MVRAMKNAYIPRDGAGKYKADFGDARFFSASSAEKPLLAVDGGITMDANAFREDIPTLSYTPEELGMKIEGTPFAKADNGDSPDPTPVEMRENPPFGAFPLTHDKNTLPPSEASNFSAEYEVLNTLNSTLSTAISKYWGIGLVAISLIGVGYYVGNKR